MTVYFSQVHNGGQKNKGKERDNNAIYNRHAAAVRET